MNPRANKGSAVKLMAEKSSIKRDEIMAIGNENNDIPMLEYAGFSVAVDNASDTVKSHADFITKSNNSHGVAYAIDRLIENNMEIFQNKKAEN